MSDYGTEVKLLAVTGPTKDFALELGRLRGLFPGVSSEDPEDLIEYSGRLCCNAEGNLGVRPGWIMDRVKQGHESILEHCSATFYIKASRVFTHELVRHRIASYSQRSQRYVKEYEPRYITPPELDIPKEGDHWALRHFQWFMGQCWDFYRQLLELGVPKEIARYVLPNACETQIVMTMNFRELRHFIKLRTSKEALPEMREVATKVSEICKDLAPQVFSDIARKEVNP